MQAQSVQTVTNVESVVCVQVLLRACLSSVACLRNLFPIENFSQVSLTSKKGSSSCSDSFGADVGPKSSKSNISQSKIISLARGFSEEADRLLDYLEYGVFDALQRQYLKSFIFAIYLDPEDPNNLAEAYTFNFTYHTVDGTNIVVPIMSLDDEFEKLALSGAKSFDPVTAASMMGKKPSLGEVKTSIKSLVMRLMHATSTMDSLPLRRYATFKLFYYNNTPSDYQPPHFRAGDLNKDKWFFTTHKKEEAPEKWSIGSLHTPFHAVNLQITSVVSHLPGTDDNSAQFTGIESANNSTHLKKPSTYDHAFKKRQIALQMRDAGARNIVWDAEDGLCDEDAEGEDDIDYVRRPDGSGYDRTLVEDGSSSAPQVPVGIRNERGTIDQFPVKPSSAEVEVRGIPNCMPPRVGEMTGPTIPQHAEKTQEIPFSQTQRQPSRSDIASIISKQASQSVSFTDDSIISTQSLMTNMVSDVDGDSEMLVLESQATDEDPIQSFKSETNNDFVKSASNLKNPDNTECECKIDINDDACFCEGGCKRWYHIWCMGYHSTQDPRIPDSFICFDCRIRQDASWLILKDEAYPRLLSKYQDLAIFRRAIKIAQENNGPDNVAKFTKLLGCETDVAAALFKRLEAEGFIAPVTITTDELGLVGTRTRTVKGKGKTKSNQKKQIQKTTYSFVFASTKTTTYANYFNPLSEAEARLIGCLDVEAAFRQRRKRQPLLPIASYENSATNTRLPQQGTQESASLPILQPNSQENHISKPASILKRQLGDVERPLKKVKFSVVAAIDLQD